jgi:serine/threonine protein kinase
VAVLAAGTILDGRYEVIAPLAEGGMGAVFRARRRLLGDEVALKIVRAESAGDQGARERFLRESRACAQLRHPNIVSILDFNLDPEGRPFLVMELLSGPSLRQEIAGRGPFTIAEMQTIILPICGALQLAHDSGILHRDLKPANIVAHDFGGGTRLYKLVDFGLVRELRSDDTRLTAAHEFIGTFIYAAPEQLTGGALDARSDQFSLAVVVYEMLTGRTPLDEPDPSRFVTSMIRDPLRPPSAVRSDLPKWVDVVLGRALAKSPEDRYPSIAAFALAMAGQAGGGRPTAITGGLAPAAAPGGLLGTYELGDRIAAGRLGSEVFRGTHRALGQPVAIRLLRRSPDRNWDAVRARFLREARTLQIAHPSIVRVRDYGEEGDLVYLVTDFIDGPNLRELMRAEGAMAWPRLKPFLAQLVDAARALHRKGGLLCGLSPEIVRVAAEEDGQRLMISTAGIWQAQDLLATMGDTTLRGGGVADVELHYVAPELLTGQNADVRSDVFTMGVLTYEMATGVLPFTGATMPALLGAMLRGHPDDLRKRQPTLPEDAAQSIMAALSPSPDARPRTAREFGAALGCC